MTDPHRRRNKGKSKKPIIIGITAVAVTAVCAAAIIWLPKLIKEPQAPDEVVQSYFQKLSNSKYKEMYEMLSDSAKESISKKDFIKRNQGIYEGIEAKKIKIVTAKEDAAKKSLSNTITVSYKTSMNTTAGELKFGNEMQLTKGSENNYEIDWTHAAIFPELEDTDKVKVKTTRASRGTIYDRNHMPLAQDGMVVQVGIVPGKLGDDKETALQTITELLGITVDEIKEALSADWVKDNLFVPIKKINASATELQVQLVGEDGAGGIPGVALNHVEDRVYPLGIQAGHLTGYIQTISAEELENKKEEGYTASDKIGKAGLEKVYEEELHGTDGVDIIIAEENGNTKETLCFKEVQGGKDVVVTIDAELQQAAYEQFSEDSGVEVALNPKTGELLSLLSVPGYDPNEFILGMSGTRWDELNNNPQDPLTNRYNNAWVPGSAFKPVTAAAGVDTGTLDPNENKGNVGLAWQKDTSWGSYKVTTLTDYGSEVTMQNALIYSDNIYFAKAALDIGAETMASELKKFGFGEELPVDLKLQTSSFGKDGKIDTEIQLADTGYGQGQLLVNPVHLASIYSAFVNEGNMILPVIRYEEGVSGSYWKEQVMSKETADLIKQDLIQVIENPNGTGASAKIEGVSLSGKTGTAETKSSQDETGAKELGWFVSGTTEETNHPILMAAMVEDVQSKGVKHYVNDKVKAIIEQYVLQQ